MSELPETAIAISLMIPPLVCLAGGVWRVSRGGEWRKFALFASLWAFGVAGLGFYITAKFDEAALFRLEKLNANWNRA